MEIELSKIIVMTQEFWLAMANNHKRIHHPDVVAAEAEAVAEAVVEAGVEDAVVVEVVVVAVVGAEDGAAAQLKQPGYFTLKK